MQAVPDIEGRRGAIGDEWRAAPAGESLRRDFTGDAFDDHGWERTTVPGHWRSVPAFSDSDGPLLYRTRFPTVAPAERRRTWLTFDGVFYQADAWIDGAYLGDVEGYFFPHTFEITEAVAGRAEHVLALEVACDRPSDLTAKRNLTGVFQHWDLHDPDWNPGGIWRPVHVHETGPVRLARVRIRCIEATSERAVFAFRATLDTATAGPARIETSVGDIAAHAQDVSLAVGENRFDWSVAVEDPPLWWPHSLGDQPLVDAAVTVDFEGERSDEMTRRTGIREVRMRDFVFSVNRERLFLKGTNQGPVRMELGEASAAEFERDIDLARTTGLDLIRVHGHVSRPELYDAADQAGMLLWQDLPLQWGYARGVRREAVRQVREAVDLLAHHPSLAIWCGHNEPLGIERRPGADGHRGDLSARALVQQQVPTWNKTVLDRSIKRALEKADESRPVVAHSGVMPHAGSRGTDSHLYFGWSRGDLRDLAPFLAAWPRMAAFVSEFGASAVPDTAGFLDADAWPDLDWDRLQHRHGLDRRHFAALGLDPAAFATFAAWRDATQRHQADVVRFHVETLRRLKYRPTGGFAQFLFSDGHPGVTFSVLDHVRRKKPAYDALAAACAPVIVVADQPDESYAPGAQISLDVHVVSDRRDELAGEVTARLSGPGGGDRSWSWAGTVGPDACVRVGTIEADAGDAPGAVNLELAFEFEGGRVRNHYASSVSRT